MVQWKNLDTLTSFKELSEAKKVNLQEVMSGENGAARVKKYNVKMGAGLSFNYAAKKVDDELLELLAKFAKEAELVEKFEELYNGAIINTGENRRVLHQLTRGQLGNAVVEDGVDKHDFYVEQQNKISAFAAKVHNGEITNAAGEIAIKGLDADTYHLREIKAPDGYNKLNQDTDVTVTRQVSTDGKTMTYTKVTSEINNQSGAELPSTGGIGTTIFYVVGGALVLGAVVLLVTRRRMAE